MIPKYNEMYNEVLSVLSKGEEVKFKDLVEEVSDILKLTPEQRLERAQNQKASVIYYRLGWTKTYLTKAGLVDIVRKGVYKITDEGLKVINSNIEVDNSFLMKYQSFVDFVSPTLVENENIVEEKVNEDTPHESIEKAIRLINSRLSSELIELINSKDPKFFESLVLDLLEKMGYAFSEESKIITPYSSDEGIDGIIEEDSFGFNRIYIQAKRWSNPVGRPEIQKFLGAVTGYGGTKSLFITTSRFTKEAIDFVQKHLAVKIILIDGNKLTDLMVKYGLGVSVVKTYELKQIDTDYFEDEV